jgi:predicted DNA-binding protein
MLKALEDVIKKEYQDAETLEGYIQFEEAQGTEIDNKIKKLQDDVKDGTDKVFTMRVKEGLNGRLEQAVRFEGTTKSKVLRSLIEFYIVQVEQEMEKGKDKIRAILREKDESKQIQMVMQLTDDEKLEYLKLKQLALENAHKEKTINEQAE